MLVLAAVAHHRKPVSPSEGPPRAHEDRQPAPVRNILFELANGVGVERITAEQVDGGEPPQLFLGDVAKEAGGPQIGPEPRVGLAAGTQDLQQEALSLRDAFFQRPEHMNPAQTKQPSHQ